MATDRDLLLAYRNARLRAWRALGVPVEASWVERRDPLLCLSLKCLECGRRADHNLPDRPAGLERTEYLAALELVRMRGCAHLGALLLPDPEGLAELAQLELLAGQ